MSNEWHVSPYTSAVQYLGGPRNSLSYRGSIVLQAPGRWAVQPVDLWSGEQYTLFCVETAEKARKALENITPDGHKCEVFVSAVVGHCPNIAGDLTVYGEGENEERGILLCPVHKRVVLSGTGQTHMSVHLWEAIHGPITHESGPIVGGRIAPPMAPVKRGHYLSKPVVWGDDWSGYTLAVKLSQDVCPGDLVVFRDNGNAYEVKSVDRIPMPDDKPLLRFNCNDGATYGTYDDRAVAVLCPPF